MSARTSTRIKAKRGPLADISNQREEVPSENGEAKASTTKRVVRKEKSFENHLYLSF